MTTPEVRFDDGAARDRFMGRWRWRMGVEGGKGRCRSPVSNGTSCGFIINTKLSHTSLNRSLVSAVGINYSVRIRHAPLDTSA